MIFQALSVIQPWPWLILRPDVTAPLDRIAVRAAGRMKDNENRAWETNVRGWILLHASSTRLAKWDYQAAAMFAGKRGIDVPIRDNLDYGALVGAIRIDGCVRQSASRWFVGPVGFVVGAAVPFKEPILCKGAQLFFPVPARGAGVGGAELEQLISLRLVEAGLAKEFRIEQTALQP